MMSEAKWTMPILRVIRVNPLMSVTTTAFLPENFFTCASSSSSIGTDRREASEPYRSRGIVPAM